MKIGLKPLTVRDVAENYRDNDEDGVIGYDGKLNIRPKYQREFVYDAEKRNAVLETIRKGFPLNVMYWAVNEDGTFEVLDGQQRTISFCQYVAGDFSINIDGHPMAFHNLTQPQKDQFLRYELMVYVCEGNERDKLDWFRTVNIAGVELTDQELRNAVYTGPWLTHAKSIFSKTNGPGYGLASKYATGSPIRQELLEKALKWKSGGKIDQYMSDHQHDQNANELWTYFQSIIWWVQQTFTTYRKEMKTVEWGPLYDWFKDEKLDTTELERRTAELMQDPVGLEFVIRPPREAGPCPGSGRSNAHGCIRHGPPCVRPRSLTACSLPTTHGSVPRCRRPGSRRASAPDHRHSSTTPDPGILAASSRSAVPQRGVTGAHGAPS